MFKEFPKIPRAEKLCIQVTQKLHGTNASVHVLRTDDWPYGPDNYCGAPVSDFLTSDGNYYILPGKRTSYISRYKDNFGFAQFVYERKDVFAHLGEGHHFGEWCGPGINSGEGLSEKRFYLFDQKFADGRPLPEGVYVVPLLAVIPLTDILQETLESLKASGSVAVPGFDRPEGVVGYIPGTGVRIKLTFDQEVSAWKRDADKAKTGLPDVSAYVNDYRLDKILSKDESLSTGLPDTFGTICNAYAADVVAEDLKHLDENALKASEKAIRKEVAKLLRKRL